MWKIIRRIWQLIWAGRNYQVEEETRMKKNEQNLRDLWDTIYYTNIGIIGVQNQRQTTLKAAGRSSSTYKDLG